MSYFDEHIERLLNEQLPGIDELAEATGVDRHTALLFVLGRYMEATNTTVGELVRTFNGWVTAQKEYNELYSQWVQEQRERQDKHDAFLERAMHVLELQEQELREYREHEDWKHDGEEYG